MTGGVTGGGEVVDELCDWGLDSDWQVVVLSACRQCGRLGGRRRSEDEWYYDTGWWPALVKGDLSS